jgi:hypothetical protein
MTTPNKDRAAFEAWCISNGKSIDGHACAAERWLSWQAACADRDLVVAELVEVLSGVNRIIEYGDGDAILDGSGMHTMIKQALTKAQTQGE